MNPELIKAAIRMAGTTPAAIADELELGRSTISHVIHGRGTSLRVQERIAKIIGKPVIEIWPNHTTLRRSRTQIVAQHDPSAASKSTTVEGAGA